jgi:transcriptional regulator with XRE-family HTH domain
MNKPPEILLIGNNIRKWRTLKGIKQSDFANQIGISKSTLSKIENGRQNISLIRMLLIAEILNIKTTQLLKDPLEFFSPQ